MKIVVLCEGRTEAALRGALSDWLRDRLPEKRVGIDTRALGGSVATPKLPRMVTLFASKDDVIGVIGLTDVYPDFPSAEEAKNRLRELVSQSTHCDKFHAHVAKFELEAWLMPFWDDITKRLGVKAKRPAGRPEEINDQKPPSKHLTELYRNTKRGYNKVLHAADWLTAKNLDTAAESCPELRAFLDCILKLAGTEPLP